MTRKEINRRYSRISSLKQLQAERQRLDWLLESREEAIGGDMEGVRELFTWDYISNAALSAVQPWASSFLGGWQGILSMFSRSARKAKGKICR